MTKGLAVIRHINAAPPSGASLHETATALGMTKSHCHNILKTLVYEGWLSYDAMRRSYSLAPRLLGDVSRLLSRGTPTAVAHDELAKLSKALDTPCVLTRVEKDGSFVAIDSVEENSELLVSVPIGHRFPPDAPAQMRVRLAWMPDDQRKIELARWQPRAYTKTTIVRKKQVAAEIEATRRRGYSISWAEFTPGVMTLAVPIFDAFGRVQMVLQCPGLIDKVSRNEAKMAEAILRTGERLNAIIGGSSDATSDIRIALS